MGVRPDVPCLAVRGNGGMTTTIPAPLDVPGPKAQALVARDRAVYAPCAGRVYPFAIERGEGCYVWDVDGNRYLDMNAGIAVVAAGHSHPRVVQAIQHQATQFVHMAGTDFYSEPMVKFGEKLVSLMPPAHAWQLFPCNSGTEAIEASIKLARYVTGRQGIVAFFGAFHGRSYGALSLTASKPVQRRGYYPLVPGTFHALYANPFRRPFDVAPERVTQACLDYIEQTLFHTIAPPRDVAAIIVEQHPQAILRISHRAVVLDRGTVVHSGGAQELLASPELIDRLLGVAR